jgi:hypothetical protein
MSAPFEGCRTGGGWEFAGYSQRTEVPEPYQYILESDVTVTSPQGDRFVGAGKIELLATDAGWTSQITGSWGMPGAGGWLDPVPGLALWDTWDGELWTAYGGYAAAAGQLYFDDVAWTPGCDAPQGNVRLRDPSGYWYDLVFPDVCGACAEVGFEGEPLGEACVAWAGVLDAHLARMTW